MIDRERRRDVRASSSLQLTAYLMGRDDLAITVGLAAAESHGNNYHNSYLIYW